MLMYIVAAIVTLVSIIVAQVLLKWSASAPALDKVEFREFPLIQKTVVSHNTAVYRFGLPHPSDSLGLPIGQHISVAATVNDKQVVRSYTPTSSDDDKGYFDLMVKSYPTGNVSKYMGNLQLGEKVKVRGPKGAFNYTRGLVREFVMIAGGTGITPMLQIIHAIAKDPLDTTKIKLIYANVNIDDILLKKEIDELVATHGNISVHYVLNNPPEGWTGSVGFVTVDILKDHLPQASSDAKILLCGPPPMVSGIKKSAEALGWEKARAVSKLEDQVFAF